MTVDNVEMFGLIVSIASFIFMVIFWFIDSFVFEKKLKSKKRATIYRIKLKKTPKNIDIYDEDYLGKIYLKHDGNVRKLGTNDIRYLEDKKKVEMLGAFDYSNKKDSMYTTTNIEHNLDEHDARVPDEEKDEILLKSSDYIFVGENEKQNSAAFYIKRAKTFNLRQLIILILIAIFASSSSSFYIAHLISKPPIVISPPYSMVSAIEYYSGNFKNTFSSFSSYKEQSEKCFNNVENNPFATTTFIDSNKQIYNSIGSSMWYVYGKLLLRGHEKSKLPIPEDKEVLNWIKPLENYEINILINDKGDLLEKSKIDIKNANNQIKSNDASYIAIWKNSNVLVDIKYRVAYIEEFKDDGEILISEAGLTEKKRDEIAILMPAVKYVVVSQGEIIGNNYSKELNLYHNNLAELTNEKISTFDILSIVDGPKTKTVETIIEPDSPVLNIIKRDPEKYLWYKVKNEAGDTGWIKLFDFHRTSASYNTEFNIQGIDLEPHPIWKYWTPVVDPDLKGAWKDKAVRIFRIPK